MQTLYAIENDYQELFAELESLLTDNPEPEAIDQLMQALDISRAELEQKAEAYAAVIQQKKARAEFLKTEAKRLEKMAKRELAQADFLHQRIAGALQRFGMAKLAGKLFSFSFRKSTSVDVYEPDALPSQYTETVVQTKALKNEIKAAIKRGEQITGAKLIESQNLQIK